MVRQRALGLGLLASTLLLSLTGVAHADKAPPPRPDTLSDKKPGDAGDAPAEAPKPPEPPQPAVRRIADTRPTRLPDGVFLGHLSGGGLSAELRVTIVAGRVIEGWMRRPGGLPILDLTPVEGGDALALRLQGSEGSEFIRINGAFFDAERGAGRFDGVLGRTQSAGTWLLARR